MSRRVSCFLFCVLACGCGGSNQDAAQVRTREQDGVTITVTADRPQARIADACSVTVEVDGSDASKVAPPVLDDRPTNFVVIETGPVETKQSNGRTTHRQAFVLECYKSGQQAIPAFRVNYAAAGTSGGEMLLRSEPISVRVIGSIGLFDDPHHYYDDVSVIDPPRGWVFYSVIGAVVCLVIALLLRTLWLNRPKNRALASPVDEALRSLASLEKNTRRGAWSAEKTVVAADAVVRRFLMRHWNLSDAQLTTNELNWNAAWRWERNAGAREALQSILQTNDRVKFAQFAATPEVANETLRNVRMLIATGEQPASATEPQFAEAAHV